MSDQADSNPQVPEPAEYFPPQLPPELPPEPPALPPVAPVPVDTERPRALLFIPIVGIAIVVLALLGLQWPMPATDSSTSGALVTHLFTERLTQRFQLGGDANIAGAILDVLVVVALLLALLFTVLGLLSRSRAPLMGLILVGVYGVIYVFSSALYLGPMISLCGFSLILFVGVITWFTFPDDFKQTPTSPTEDTNGAQTPILTTLDEDSEDLQDGNRTAYPAT